MNSTTSGLARRKAAKRETIIAGAIKAFEQEGYDKASMDLVAEFSGASKRTVYNHFESKKALLWAVIEGLMAGQRELKQVEYSKTETLESQLGRFVDSQLYFVTDPTRLSLARVITSIFVRSPELCEEVRKESQSQHDHLVAWLKAAAKDKRTKAANPKLAAQVFYGMIEGMINFPALYHPVQKSAELKLIKDEIIAVFLSRYAFASRYEPQ